MLAFLLAKENFMSLTRRLRALSLVTACSVAMLAAVAPASAQTYPDRSVRIIVPFGAGGITDVVARLVGQHLGEELNQTMVIENRTGAGGAIGATLAAQAQPDGYTLMLGTVGTQVVNKMLYKKLSYDPAAFTPISLVSNSPFVLAINDIPGVTNLQQLAAYAKSHPDALSFGSAGNGSTPHLGLELFKLSTGTNPLHVPFKSGAEAVNAALGGQVQGAIDAIPVIQPHAKSGKLRILAVLAKDRNNLLPGVPTSAEQGFPQFQIGAWTALVAPPGTPQDRIDTLNAALARAMKRPALVARLAQIGVEPMNPGVPAYLAHVQSETEKWGKVTKAAGTQRD
jgi:tripartite-type tricarboxylate transporter receptor subunit TctC